MENLAELINRILTQRGETVTAFAARIGVNRLTVKTWASSLPASATLRRVADDLALPYSHVLAAALASTGYATSAADLMAGQQVHVVTHFGDEDTDDGTVAVAFTDPGRAAAYAEAIRVSPGLFGVEESIACIDGAEIPDTITVFTTVWSSRTDDLRQTTSLSRSVPTRLQDRDTTPVEATALADGDGDQIISLQADSLNAEAGRAAITAAVEMLRQQGRLLPPSVDPFPGVSGRVAYAMAKQAKGSTSAPRSGAETFSSPMQTVPPVFAAAHDRARTHPDGAQDATVVWPAMRRFVVEAPQ